jgi:hypothetical protein
MADHYAGRAFLDFLQTPIQPTSDDRQAPDVSAILPAASPIKAGWSKSAPTNPSAGGPEETFRSRIIPAADAWEHHEGMREVSGTGPELHALTSGYDPPD